jgi:DNA-binding response OmpR family regulator
MSLQTSPIDAKILVVEDEPHISEHVVRSLQQQGFATAVASSREDIFKAIEVGNCAALVLDLGLPGDDGVKIAIAIRERHDPPILMLTGRAGIHARVTGLEAGADDYLVKPFAPEELVARLRAILRRSRTPTAAPNMPTSLTLGHAYLDLVSRKLTGTQGTTTVTELESRLLLLLARSQGALSREAIYRDIFSRDWDSVDRSLDVHIAHLRGKFRKVCSGEDIIATVRGGGYKLCVPARIGAAAAPPHGTQRA